MSLVVLLLALLALAQGPAAVAAQGLTAEEAPAAPAAPSPGSANTTSSRRPGAMPWEYPPAAPAAARLAPCVLAPSMLVSRLLSSWQQHPRPGTHGMLLAAPAHKW
jgi:hypothetical protein